MNRRIEDRADTETAVFLRGNANNDATRLEAKDLSSAGSTSARTTTLEPWELQIIILAVAIKATVEVCEEWAKTTVEATTASEVEQLGEFSSVWGASSLSFTLDDAYYAAK